MGVKTRRHVFFALIRFILWSPWCTLAMQRPTATAASKAWQGLQNTQGGALWPGGGKHVAAGPPPAQTLAQRLANARSMAADAAAKAQAAKAAPKATVKAGQYVGNQWGSGGA